MTDEVTHLVERGKAWVIYIKLMKNYVVFVKEKLPS